MPGPFPGMNPYLEDSFYWQGFHNGLISDIRKALNAILPSGYRAVIEQRLVILPDDQIRRADLAWIHRPSAPAYGSDTGIIMKERGMPDGKVGVLFEEIYDWFVEVRTGLKHDNRVVTVIELLSPSNKASGSQGRREYKQKQRQLLHSDTNLLEIDLLRHGSHTVLAPLESLPPRNVWDYIVCLHRCRERFQCEYWLNQLSAPLPAVRAPLLQEDPDIILDLQAVYQESYTAGRFEEDMDYTSPLPPNPYPPSE